MDSIEASPNVLLIVLFTSTPSKQGLFKEENHRILDVIHELNRIEGTQL